MAKEIKTETIMAQRWIKTTFKYSLMRGLINSVMDLFQERQFSTVNAHEPSMLGQQSPDIEPLDISLENKSL